MRALSLCCLWIASTASAAPYFSHQGRLLDAQGAPIVGSHDVRVTIYDASTGGASCWQKTFAATPFSDGYYAVPISGVDATARDLASVASNCRWVGVAIDGGADLTSRQQIGDHLFGGGAATGVTAGSAAPGGACTGNGAMVWDAADRTLYACDGSVWFIVTTAPGGAYRYWRLRLVQDDPADNVEFLGGWTLYTGQGGAGTNLGLQAGPGAYSVFGSAPHSIWDPVPNSDFTTLTGQADTTDGRVQCNNFATSGGNCWVRLDLGTPQQVRSWGMMGRPNLAVGHWQGVQLQASNDNVNWTLIDERLGLGLTQGAVRIFNTP